MIIKNKTLLGSYAPAFFHIALETRDELIMLNLLNNPAYIHEYIHFIQDVTTIQGLTTIDVFNEDMRVVIQNIYNQKDKSFNVPIKHIIDREEVNSYSNFINLLNGDDVSISDICEIKNIEHLKTVMDKYSPVDDLCIKVMDKSGNVHDISFGAFAIKESMAYIMEQNLSPSWEKSPDFPYNFAFRLTEHIYPEFTKDILNILALCDISLQFLNSGEVFYDILTKLKSENILPQKPEDIYDLIYPLQIDKSSKTLEENITEAFNCSKKKLLSYFNDKIYFKNIRSWIEYTLSMALRKRLDDRYFLLKLARGGIASNNNIFKDLHFFLGTPVISNLLGGSISVINEQEIDLKWFIAMSQIRSLFEFGIYKCSLYVICKKEEKFIDENCLKSPWMRCGEKEKKCYYTTLWKHWGLQGYIPKL
jgi:hypothetical protein